MHRELPCWFLFSLFQTVAQVSSDSEDRLGSLPLEVGCREFVTESIDGLRKCSFRPHFTLPDNEYPPAHSL